MAHFYVETSDPRHWKPEQPFFTVPQHTGGLTSYAEAAANLLTVDAVDPVAKIPEYKVAAVSVERV